MHAPSNAGARRSARLGIKLFVATAAVATTAGIAMNEWRAPNDAARPAATTGAGHALSALAVATGHTPLSEAAPTSVSDLPDALAADANAATARP